MKSLQFEWDPAKAFTNIKKHGITFEEARTVFDDDYGRLLHDPDHSQEEERFILLGMSYTLKIVLLYLSFKVISTVNLHSPILIHQIQIILCYHEILTNPS